MLQSFIALPNFCPYDATIDGKTYSPAHDNAFRMEYIIRGREIPQASRLSFYKSHTFIKNLGFEIVFASLNNDCDRPDIMFNDMEAGSRVLLPIYFRSRGSIDLPCVLHIPNINKLFGLIGVDTVVSWATYVNFALSRSYNVNIGALPSAILDKQVDESWGTLMCPSDDTIDSFEDDDPSRLQARVDKECIIMGQIPDEIRCVFENVTILSQIRPFLNPKYAFDPINILAFDAASWINYRMHAMLNHEAFNECGHRVHVCSASAYDTTIPIQNLLITHSLMPTSEFRIGTPSFVGGYGLQHCSDPLNGLAPIPVRECDITYSCHLQRDLSYCGNEPFLENIFGEVVGTYLEGLFVTHINDPDMIIMYYSLPLWILASGGGLINSDLIRGIQ